MRKTIFISIIICFAFHLKVESQNLKKSKIDTQNFKVNTEKIDGKLDRNDTPVSFLTKGEEIISYTPPYLNAEYSQKFEILTKMGFQKVLYSPNRDLASSGKINQSSLLELYILGQNTFCLENKIIWTLNVQESGSYKISINGNINGGIFTGSKGGISDYKQLLSIGFRILNEDGYLIGQKFIHPYDTWDEAGPDVIKWILEEFTFKAALEVVKLYSGVKWVSTALRVLDFIEMAGTVAETCIPEKYFSNNPFDIYNNGEKLFFGAELITGENYSVEFVSLGYTGAGLSSYDGGFIGMNEITSSFTGLELIKTSDGEPDKLIAPVVVASKGTIPDKIHISWSEVTEATGYQLYKNTLDNSETATYIDEFSNTNREYEDTDVEPNKTYYYWVKAYSNATGEYVVSAFSNSDIGWSTGTQKISFSDYRINDGNDIGGEGDGDGKAESGELIELDVELYNSGTTNAQDVRAILSTEDPDIEIIKDDLSWGRIDPDTREWDSDSEFRISYTCPTKVVTFKLDITSTSTEETWSSTFDIPVYNIPTIYIPDANFEQALIDEGIDTDGTINQKILISDAESVDDDLSLENRNISSLTGISAFKNIQRLYCAGNQISELDISNNKKLYSLYCEENLLTELDVSNNTNLIKLRCAGNQIEILEVSHNTQLEYLSCSGNPITSLDLSSNTALTTLNCNNTQLRSLNLQNNLQLIDLGCDGNKLENLDISKNTKLTNLECDDNLLSSLDLSQNGSLTELWCRRNQLTNITFSQNNNLTILECESNKLTGLDLSKNTALIEVDCSFNELISLDASDNHSLTDLICESNQLFYLDMRNGISPDNIDLRAESNNLTCINVDDENHPDLDSWDVDDGVVFSQDCPKDLDGDGVLDELDLCPGTPLGELVNSEGCSESQLDDDNDGVMNNLDNCADTPTGEAVNSEGCSESQLDDDGDGVMNNLDNCPDTPSGETVNSEGCSESQLDDDNDGVMNNMDNCPDTPTGEAANSEGCSESQLDDDNDGVMNNLDNCPDTPTGEAVNSDGCSESQLDDDSDGVMNNLDNCPDTPSGETVNSEGCSESQLDDDVDGVMNNLDNCPDTPTGESVNSEGCSESQLDDDNDGVMNNLDNCSNTPSGETVNSEGCSESQLDDDIDGVMNNLDNCSNTPSGETVNSEGCSESQLDDDSDGVMNNLDNCADTPTGESVNSEGCSESQLDDDGDGVMNNLDNCADTPTGEAVNSEGCSESQVDANTNHPPNKPVITSPSTDEVVPLVSDGAGHKVFSIEWTCSDPDNDELTYYVSIGRTQSNLEDSEKIETLAKSMSLYFNDPDHDYTGIWYTRVLATDGQDTVSSDVVRFELDWPTAIKNIGGTGVVYRIYPNPTDDNLTIEFSTIPQKYSIEFYNSMGQRVLHTQSSNQIEVLDLEKFPGGIYYLKLYNKEFSQTERIVVR